MRQSAFPSVTTPVCAPKLSKSRFQRLLAVAALLPFGKQCLDFRFATQHSHTDGLLRKHHLQNIAVGFVGEGADDAGRIGSKVRLDMRASYPVRLSTIRNIVVNQTESGFLRYFQRAYAVATVVMISAKKPVEPTIAV